MFGMNLHTWQSLAEPAHEELIRVAAETNPRDVAAVDRLRKLNADRDLIHAALQLAEARRKAVPKFGKRAATLWADPQGVEMATSAMAADYKAGRFQLIIPDEPVYDLCCGIGGDSMQFGTTEMPVTAVDLDPVRAWMAGRNAKCTPLVADATQIDVEWAAVHIDPPRRTSTSGSVSRLWKLGDLHPGIEVMQALFARTKWGGAIKLGPGVDHAEVRTHFPQSDLQFISENGTLTQAVVWIGEAMLASPGHACALLLQGHPDDLSESWIKHTTEIRGVPDERPPPIAADHRPLRYLFEVDDSVERSHLQHVLCEAVHAPLLHHALGLLTADALIAHPMLTPFEVLEVLPWNAKRVKAALAEHNAGIVEVKTRGGAVNPDQVQAELRGTGDEILTVFVLRFDRELRALIAKRAAHHHVLSHRA